MPRAQSVQMFLPSGDPNGIRVCEIRTRTVRVLDVPRANFIDFLRLPDAEKSGIFFLVGKASREMSPMCFIGASDGSSRELQDSATHFDEWDRLIAVVFNNPGMDFTYLSSRAIDQVKAVRVFDVVNKGKSDSGPAPSEYIRSDADDIMETIDIITAAIGMPIFRRPVLSAFSGQPASMAATVAASATVSARPVSDVQLFECKQRTSEAYGYPVEDGFRVLAGSVTSCAFAPSFPFRLREAFDGLVEKGLVVKHSNGGYRYVEDHVFKSPSTAASMVCLSSQNGMAAWKLPDGRQLKEVWKKKA